MYIGLWSIKTFLMKGTHLSGTHDTLAVGARIVKMTLGYCYKYMCINYSFTCK